VHGTRDGFVRLQAKLAQGDAVLQFFSLHGDYRLSENRAIK